MQSVLISIRPQWCELIASGKKTIEVRKSRPKLETPFKCYIYCTQGSKHLCLMQNEGGVNLIACCNWTTALPVGGAISNGKVIGEFVCDAYIGWSINPLDGLYMIFPNELQQACLTGTEFEQYGNGKTLYGWHISALQIYDKPKELSEFTKFGYDTQMPCCRMSRPPQSWAYIEELEEPCKTKN